MLTSLGMAHAAWGEQTSTPIFKIALKSYFTSLFAIFRILIFFKITSFSANLCKKFYFL